MAWYVPLVASAIAIIPATWLFGGRGHFLWHPAVVGRVIVQFMFAQQLAVGAGAPPAPILARDRLLLGDIANAEPVPLGHYQGWRHTALGPGADAILVERPATTLRRLAAGALPRADDAPLTAALRDCLPPWRDTVLGTVPGGIGESCTIALVVAALYLVYRGHLRWQLPLAGMLAAGLCAQRCQSGSAPAQPTSRAGCRRLIVENGESVGWLYVLYHLTSGQLLLGLVLLASDMPTCPMTSRGQALFGAGVGALTIAMRQFGVAEGECYWALLALNTVVPPLDRWTRRRPLAILS
ncbi:MAG: RnfABCDGE type electron transport complex subunit D [Phycisphaerae bacterium]